MMASVQNFANFERYQSFGYGQPDPSQANYAYCGTNQPTGAHPEGAPCALTPGVADYLIVGLEQFPGSGQG